MSFTISLMSWGSSLNKKVNLIINNWIVMVVFYSCTEGYKYTKYVTEIC